MNDKIHNAKIVAGILSRRVLTGPHSVTVSIVDACNYRCVMCWEHSSVLEGWGADDIARDYHASKKFKSTVMDFDLYRNFIVDLARTGTRQLGISGIGEPLLHKRIVDAVSLGKDHGMSVWITSNGSLLNEELMQELAAAGLDDISISINAGARDEYGSVHANQENSRFDEIVANLKWLKEYKKKNGLQLPRVTLSNVVSNINSHRSLEMLQTGIEVGAATVTYRPIDVFDKNAAFALGKNDLAELHGVFTEVNHLAKQHGIATNTNQFERLVDLRTSDSIPSPCFAGWISPMVMANGDVTYCCISREVIGNLNERSFSDIWFDPSRRQLNDIALKIHKTQESVPKSRCLGCEQTLQNLKLYKKLWPLWGRPHTR